MENEETSGSGWLGSVANIIGSIGSVFVSAQSTKQKEVELETLKVTAENQGDLTAKQVLLESVKLKQAELTAAQKSQNSQNVLVGSIAISALALGGWVLYLVLRPDKEKATTTLPQVVKTNNQNPKTLKY